MPYDYKLLRASREKKGWTGPIAARKLGVTRQAISYMELGQRQSPPLVVAYAKVLGISVNKLVISEAKFRALQDEDSREVRV